MLYLLVLTQKPVENFGTSVSCLTVLASFSKGMTNSQCGMFYLLLADTSADAFTTDPFGKTKAACILGWC
jgi:hypothetical protein